MRSRQATCCFEQYENFMNYLASLTAQGYRFQ